MPNRRPSSLDPQTVSVYCNECGVVFDALPLDAAQPTEVMFCPEHTHLWQNIGWWTLYTHGLQEAKKAAECVWKAAQDHLLGLLPPGDRHEIEGLSVKPKSYEFLKRDAIQWLQAFHPGAYDAFRQERKSVFIDPLPGGKPGTVDHVPF